MSPATPRSSGELRKRVRSKAKAIGQTEGRVSNLLSFEILAVAFEQARRNGSVDGYAIKGGASIALRHAPEVRTTKDLDVEVIVKGQNLDDLLRTILANKVSGFTFSVKKSSLTLHGTLRVQVGIAYNNQPWATVDVDVREADPQAKTETVRLRTLEEFGIAAPPEVTCLSATTQVAQKLHAMTAPQTNPSNERIHDLIDILTLESDIAQRLDETRSEAERIFQDRGTHAWPPTDPIPERWTRELEQLAEESGLPKDGHEIIRTYSRLLAAILGVTVLPNFQYHFLVLAAHQSVPTALSTAIDTTTIGYETFKRLTEHEGWRLSHVMPYPSRDQTRAMLAILERQLPPKET